MNNNDNKSKTNDNKRTKNTKNTKNVKTTKTTKTNKTSSKKATDVSSLNDNIETIIPKESAMDGLKKKIISVFKSSMPNNEIAKMLKDYIMGEKRDIPVNDYEINKLDLSILDGLGTEELKKKLLLILRTYMTEEDVESLVDAYGNEDEDIISESIKSIEDDYADEMNDTDNEEDYEIVNVDVLSPKGIKDCLDRTVIGQEHAKKVIAVAMYNHMKRIITGNKNIKKSNILMVGPSGCGKTEIARTIANAFDLPFAIVDATSLTATGYVGEEVESILLKLARKTNFDIEKTEKGIIFIDEIDKLSRVYHRRDDIGGEMVQQELLKLIEGAECLVSRTGKKSTASSTSDMLSINTENILFICSGAFEFLTMDNADENAIGFDIQNSSNISSTSNKPKIITVEDINKKSGMIPELIGRLPIFVQLDALTEDDLKLILTEPDNAITKQYSELLAIDKVNLVWENSALEFIAKESMRRGTGARGLKSIIENELNELMFDIPGEFEGTISVVCNNDKLEFIRTKNDNDEMMTYASI